MVTRKTAETNCKYMNGLARTSYILFTHIRKMVIGGWYSLCQRLCCTLERKEKKAFFMPHRTGGLRDNKNLLVQQISRTNMQAC